MAEVQAGRESSILEEERAQQQEEGLREQSHLCRERLAASSAAGYRLSTKAWGQRTETLSSFVHMKDP